MAFALPVFEDEFSLFWCRLAVIVHIHTSPKESEIQTALGKGMEFKL